MFDEEEIVTTTTTTYHDQPVIAGRLQVQREGSSCFVTDPADGEKVFVNSSDDMYEDANGRVWRLA